MKSVFIAATSFYLGGVAVVAIASIGREVTADLVAAILSWPLDAALLLIR